MILSTLFCAFKEIEVKQYMSYTTLQQLFNIAKSNIAGLFLGTVVKLRKRTTTFVTPVSRSICPSVRMEQVGSHWKGFHQT
jgi:hypothetical protein